MNVINDLILQYKIGGMTTKLIFWNVLLFILPEVVFAILKLFLVNLNYQSVVGLSNVFLDLLYQPWTIITYSFFHAGFFHLVFNMLMLNFVGKQFTTFFTQKQLLGLYILGGFFGGLIYITSYTFLPLLAHQNAIMVGASASVMAILVATTTYQPFMEVRLMLFGTVKLWHIAIVFIAIDLIQLPMENTGGHLAHLGGATFGFLFIKLIQNGIDLSSGVSKIIDFCINLFSTKEKTPLRTVHRNVKPQNVVKPESKIVTKTKSQQQIDEILDKISKSGYDSLSAGEKEFLFKAGNS
jgi:membrane associated rhomboid family serine protease